MENREDLFTGSFVSKPELRSLLNAQNFDLWRHLQQYYSFEVEESPENVYLTYFDADTVIIEVDVSNLSPAYFTHELLHVYLKAEGVLLTRDFRGLVIKDKDLLQLFSTSLRVHIGNCLEHVKILPLFLARGFSNEEFIRDYHSKITHEETMRQLEQKYRSEGEVDPMMADLFMDWFFSMKAANNPAFDYGPDLRRLEALDPGFFEIHSEFWKAWSDFQIGDPKEKYLKHLNCYLAELKEWKQAEG